MFLHPQLKRRNQFTGFLYFIIAIFIAHFALESKTSAITYLKPYLKRTIIT